MIWQIRIGMNWQEISGDMILQDKVEKLKGNKKYDKMSIDISEVLGYFIKNRSNSIQEGSTNKTSIKTMVIYWLLVKYKMDRAQSV